MTFYYRRGGQWVEATAIHEFHGSTSDSGGGGGDTITTGTVEDFEALSNGDDLGTLSSWVSDYANQLWGDTDRALDGSVSVWSGATGYSGYGSYPGDGLALYPEMPCTIRCATYVDQGSFDIIFGATDTTTDINSDCYYLRGSDSATARTSGHDIVLKEGNTATTLSNDPTDAPTGSWLDYAIDVAVVDSGAVEIGWTGWEWDGSTWNQFASDSATDSAGTWANEQGVGIGRNDGDGANLGVSFDAYRVKSHGDRTNAPEL